MLFVATELRASPIAGVGVFLLAPVKKGDLIWRFDTRIDRVFSEAELVALPEPAHSFVKIRAPWHKKSGLYVLSGDNARYFNHSDQPTTMSDGDGLADDIAAADLAVGTELTTNYHEFYDNKDLLQSMQLK